MAGFTVQSVRWNIVGLGVLAVVTAAGRVSAADALRPDTDGFRRVVAPLFQKHCIDCHGPDEQEAKLALHDIDADLLGGEQFEQWRIIEERLRYGEMPPDGEPRPSQADLQSVLKWIRQELLKTQQPGAVTDLKLLLPAYGNYVDHDALFGQPAGPVVPAAPRLWRMRPEIYDRFTSSITERVQGSSQPFSVLSGSGFKDYAVPYSIDEPTTDLLLRNAELVADNQTGPRSKWRDLKALADPDQPPTREQVESAIRTEYRLALHREPSDEELQRCFQLWERNVAASDHVIGGKAMLMAIVMQPEALFRLELGDGPADPHGRRRLSPSEIAVAVSYALRDQLDNGILRAASDGALADAEQVAAHVERMLHDPKKNNLRIMQFFREYFGYPEATAVFKDRPERGVHNAGQLVKDLEFLIEHILKQDKNVFHELLTTNKVFVNYAVDKKRGTKMPAVKIGGYATAGYAAVYGLPPDWKWTAEQPIDLADDERAGVLTHPAWLVAWSGNFDNDPVRRGNWVRTHLLGGTVPDVPIGVDARIPEDQHRTLRQRLDAVSLKAECWRCHNKMNPLGVPFEQFDHYGNFREKEIGRPVDTSGAITRTGDARLEGTVAGPVEMIHKLAASERVEQVFVRHAFRFFLGRNETLGDAATLQQAHQAYKDSGGSLKTLVVSLLTSDSFLYRSE